MLEGAVHIDFETRSATDLRKSGVYRYVEDPTTFPWMFRYRWPGSLVYEWRPGYPDPTALLDHVANGRIVVAHGAGFERTIWNCVVVARICPHWPLLRIEQQDCTMARAAAIAFPQSLDMLGAATGQNTRKDKDGHALMMRMAKPRRFEADGTVVWWDDPADVDRLSEYCAQDVKVEEEADGVLPPLTDTWRQVWIFDQIINERGVRIDHHAVSRCEALVEHAKKQNDRAMRQLTNGAVPKCTNDKKLIAWLNDRGVECTSLAKGAVDDVVFMANAGGDQDACDAITLRGAAWKTSTAKYKSMLKCVSQDNRIRGLLNFHGASTGRWAGRLVQPQNFPRNSAGREEAYDDDFLEQKVGLLHELLSGEFRIADVYDILHVTYGSLHVMSLLSKALRSMVVADTGKKLVGGDFSNIEGRVNAWQAGEAWKLQAFTDFDNGTGPDLYKLAYARSFNVPVDEVGKGAKRQIGKVQELALGYQGAVGAYLDMGATYGVDPYELAGNVHSASGVQQWDATAKRYHFKGTRQYGLFEREWTALQILVDNWRAANKAIVQSWWNLADAAVAAVASPNNVVYPEHTRLIYFFYDGRSLWMALPSGRMLHYANAQIITEKKEFANKITGEVKERTTRSVRYEGVDSKTRQWSKQRLYGGHICENAVQAIAVDVLVEAMFKVEHDGFPIVLTVHDEIVAEVDQHSNYHSADRMKDRMLDVSDTYAGLPLSAGTWEDQRYVK